MKKEGKETREMEHKSEMFTFTEPSIERLDHHSGGGRGRKGDLGQRNKETSGVSALRLNADFKAGSLSTPMVNFPPCLLELPLTRQWMDK